MIKISLVDWFKNNKKTILFSLMAVFTFLTWFLKINEFINLALYISILIILVVFKAKTKTLVMFALFSVMGQNEPAVLEYFDNLYFNKHNTNIDALDTYYVILYIVIIFLVGVIALIRAILNKEKPKGKLLIPMALLTSYGLITLIWAPAFIPGISELSFFIQGYLVYLFVRNESDEKTDFYKFSWFLSLFVLVLSFQYLTVYIKYPGANKSPLYHLWANPNIVAAVFGVTFIPSLYKYFSNQRSKYTYLYLPVELFIIWAIVKSQSMGLHYAFIAGAAFIPVMFVKNKKVLYGIISGSILAFIAFLVIVVRLEEQFPEIYNKLNEFSTSRFDIYKLALEQLKTPKDYIFGLGLGYDRSVIDVNFFHSWFFQVLVNRGLICLSIVGVMLYFVVEILDESEDKFRYFLAIGIIIYLAHGITDSGFDYQYLGVFYYLMVALLEKNNELEMNNNTNKLQLED